MEAKKENSSPLGSFVLGVGSTFLGLIIFGLMIGVIIIVARKVAEPTKVVSVKDATTSKSN